MTVAASILGLVLLSSRVRVANAGVNCNETANGSDACDELLGTTGSECVDGVCTNPLAGGCLRHMLPDSEYGDYAQRRVCNSDDDATAEERGLCSTARLAYFDYTEMRISPNSWASAILSGWILQILLSELLFVPSSIETGNMARPLSFYDERSLISHLDYTDNDFGALLRAGAMANLDCRATEERCAHVLPEVWAERTIMPEDLSAIEPDFLGIQGEINWYAPRHTLDEYPELASYFGLQGEGNREKLASIFKRPVNWADYCAEVSESKCSDAEDEYSTGRPTNIIDGARYHIEGKYRGFFRATERNNCTFNPSNCTGHIVDTPCDDHDIDARTESQLYWNNISLENDVRYDFIQMRDIFRAANETRSHVMILWWEPEPTIAAYDFQAVTLPRATQECMENILDLKNSTRCDYSLEERRGKKEGSCGYLPQSLVQFYPAALRDSTDATPKAARSPAYQFLKNFQMKEVEMREILLQWDRRGRDRYGYDMRHAVCSWVAKSINNTGTSIASVTRFVPPGYPREVQMDELGYDDPLDYFALVFASVVAVGVLLTLASTYKFRGSTIIRYAQVQFLYLFCLGYFLVCIGALLRTMMPTDARCVAAEWLVLLGYTFGNVPLLVKTAAINRLMQSGKKMRRTKISQRALFVAVGFAVLVSSAILAAWTAVTNPTREVDLVLQEDNGSFVDLYPKCSTAHAGWGITAFSWQGIFIVCAAILAFQSRNVRQEFNESKNIGHMAYLSFLFLVFRITVAYMPPDVLPPHVQAGVGSVLLSFDSALNMLVYFAPKFWLLKFPNDCGNNLEHRATQPAFVPNFSPTARPRSSTEYCSQCNCPKCKANEESMAPLTREKAQDTKTAVEDTSVANVERVSIEGMVET